MHRFFLPPEACAARPLRLTGAEAHHAARVLRLRRGDAATVLDGQGGQYDCRVAAAQPKLVDLEVVNFLMAPPPPRRLTLFQALPKHKTWDTLLAKATELGVTHLAAVMTGRTVPHASDAQMGRPPARWRQAVIEACKQCGQPWLPEVSGPWGWDEALQRWDACELHLAGLLHNGAARVRAHFADFAAAHGRLPASVGVWIGPEGDFTPAESAVLRERGVRPITLGPLVLRVDTAALAALALVNDEYLAAAAVDGPAGPA